MTRLFGIEGDPDPVLKHLEERLGRFEAHRSLYLGEYRLYQGERGERIQLRANISPVDGEYAEPGHPSMDHLLLVDGATAAIEEALRACGASIVLLREY